MDSKDNNEVIINYGSLIIETDEKKLLLLYK